MSLQGILYRQMKKYQHLRQKYPRFGYLSSKWEVKKDRLHLNWHFRLEGKKVKSIDFYPTASIPLPTIDNPKKITNQQSIIIDHLVFNLGLVEMLSYWKATASPEIVIQAGTLDKNQLNFWQKLLTYGMGEYFYLNQIPFWEKGFIKLSLQPLNLDQTFAQLQSPNERSGYNFSQPDRELAKQMSKSQELNNLIKNHDQERERDLRVEEGLQPDRELAKQVSKRQELNNLIKNHDQERERDLRVEEGLQPDRELAKPINEGQELDTLIKNHHQVNIFTLAINPTDAITQTVKLADLPLISVKRQLDPTLLKLNQQGFLNGHTPFSALVAFTSILVAQLYQLNQIALSNELSANEPTLLWHGHPINHQYSKSLQFETDFRKYIENLYQKIAISNQQNLPSSSTPSFLIPLGGGKDSIVTLQLIKQYIKNNLQPLNLSRSSTQMRNPNERSGYNFSQPDRKLVEQMSGRRELNKPTKNHNQERERDLRVEEGLQPDRELATQVSEGQKLGDIEKNPNYFSFLRPLYELEIAHLFSQVGKKYFYIFRSCNVGQKQGVWCGQCPKCLFAFTMIFPFIGQEKAQAIWGKNLFEDKNLLTTAYQLVGAKVDQTQNVKPFECVGTQLESLVAFWLASKWYQARQQKLPYILKQFQLQIFPQHQNLKQKAGEILSHFDKNHHLPKELELFLEKTTQNLNNRHFLLNLKSHTTKLKDSQGFKLDLSTQHDNTTPPTNPQLKTPHYVIFGLGREGISSFNFLVKQKIRLENIILIDDKPVNQLPKSWQKVIKKHNLTVTKSNQFITKTKKSSRQSLITPQTQFLIIKSPGIPPTHSLIRWAKKHQVPTTSNTEIFFKAVRSIKKNRPMIIGVTGTKGKSTTSTLIAHILKKAGYKVNLGGNLGTPPLDLIKDFKAENSAVALKLIKQHVENNLQPLNLSELVRGRGKISNHDRERERDLRVEEVIQPDRELVEQMSGRRELNRPTKNHTQERERDLRVEEVTQPDRELATQMSKKQELNNSVEVYNQENKQDLRVKKVSRPNQKPTNQISLDLRPIYVLELSSHQLADLNQSPDIAVWLNLYPEHLDYYQNINQYAQAKANIFKHQKSGDFLIYNADDPIVSQLAKQANSHLVPLTQKEADQINLNQTKLLGRHNQLNLLAAVKVVNLFHLNQKEALKLAHDFTPLPHRLELVTTTNQVTYINDSLATNPGATIKAIEAFSDKELILIVGGYDRGLDYKTLAQVIVNQPNIKAVITLPDTGKKIFKLIKNLQPTQLATYSVANLNEAVALAKKIAQPGNVVLLSPASASFNQFKDYRQRGEAFRQLVSVS